MAAAVSTEVNSIQASSKSSMIDNKPARRRRRKGRVAVVQHLPANWRLAGAPPGMGSSVKRMFHRVKALYYTTRRAAIRASGLTKHTKPLSKGTILYYLQRGGPRERRLSLRGDDWGPLRVAWSVCLPLMVFACGASNMHQQLIEELWFFH